MAVQVLTVNRLYRVAACDPAGGPVNGRKQSGLSRASITVLGEDDKERMVILETWAKRIPPDKLIDRIFETQARYLPAIFGIDATGPQLAFYQILLKEARERGVKWNPKPIAFQMEKTDSIEKTIQPVAASGRLMRPNEAHCYQLKEEWNQFPTGQYRDALDTLAMCIRLMPTVLPAHMRMLSEAQLRAYLQRMGHTKEAIEERLAQREQFR